MRGSKFAPKGVREYFRFNELKRESLNGTIVSLNRPRSLSCSRSSSSRVEVERESRRNLTEKYLSAGADRVTKTGTSVLQRDIVRRRRLLLRRIYSLRKVHTPSPLSRRSSLRRRRPSVRRVTDRFFVPLCTCVYVCVYMCMCVRARRYMHTCVRAPFGVQVECATG